MAVELAKFLPAFAMRFTFGLLFGFACLFLQSLSAGKSYYDTFENRTLAVVEKLFEEKGLNPDKLAGTMVDALIKSRKLNARLIELIVAELFNHCQAPTKIVDALGRSSEQLNRLHELLNSYAVGI